MKLNKLAVSVFILLILFLASCSSDRIIKRETKKYNKLSSGIKYSAYKSFSKTTISKTVKLYNSDKEDSAKVSEDDVRLFIGFMMELSKSYSFSVAEATMIINESQDSNNIYLAHKLLSSVMYQNKWTKIASLEEQKAELGLFSSEEIPKASLQYLTSELIFAKKNIDSQNFDEAIMNLANLCEGTEIEWPQKFCTILMDIKNGNTKQAKINFDAFICDTTIPENIKEYASKIFPKLLANPNKLAKLELISTEYFAAFLKDLRIAKSANSALNSIFDMLINIMGSLR